MPDGVNSNQAVSDAATASVPDATLSETPPRPANHTRPVEIRLRQSTAETRPPVNLRLTFPVFGKRFYFALVSGKERRGHERIALERRRNPIRTRSNLAFIFIGAMILYMLTLGTFLVYAAVIEM